MPVESKEVKFLQAAKNPPPIEVTAVNLLESKEVKLVQRFKK